ncbi:MAG: VanZ family protein [Lachnospiraceae bacterium]
MTTNKQKRILHTGRILFFIYMLVLIYFLFFSDGFGRTTGTGEYRYNLIPFNEIKRYILYSDMFTSTQIIINLFGNIMAFLPFGFFVPMTTDEHQTFIKVTFISMFFSACVESIQLITKVGSFDVDDIILNTVGGAVGYLLYYIIFRSCCNKNGKAGRK